MLLAAVHIGNASTAPPSGQAESPQEPTDPETREWLRLTDLRLAFLRGAPQLASWTAVSLVVLSVPDPTGTAPCSTWYLMFVPQDPSVQQPHTIDLATRPWRVEAEECSFTFAFELGDVREGNALRYFVQTGSKRSFDYLFSYVAYINACRVGALVEAL